MTRRRRFFDVLFFIFIVAERETFMIGIDFKFVKKPEIQTNFGSIFFSRPNDLHAYQTL